MPITNFTNDWNDGRAVGALVDAVAPGICHFLFSYFCYFFLTYLYSCLDVWNRFVSRLERLGS
jgi:hypothetical protein